MSNTRVPRQKRSFAAATADSESPLPFDLTLTNAAGETKTLDFELAGEAPADAMEQLAKAQRVTNAGDEVIDASQLFRFFERALIGDGPTRFRAMVNDHEWMIPLGVLGEIWEWAIEEWTGRPTTQPPSSPEGRSPSSATSTEPSPQPASTS